MSRRWRQVKHGFKRNRPAQFFLLILVIFTISAGFAGLTPWDPNQMSLQARMLSPDVTHWFGTDEYGRDYFTRAFYGGQISLVVGFLAMLFSTLIGTVSGYFGGRLDNILMRLVDILMSIPAFFLLLNAYLKPGIANIILIISALTWMSISRLVRAETLSIKEREYVIYARASGENPLWIIARHIIPNILPTIIIAATLNIASAILMESTLSFLGLGVQQPNASWGSMFKKPWLWLPQITKSTSRLVQIARICSLSSPVAKRYVQSGNRTSRPDSRETAAFLQASVHANFPSLARQTSYRFQGKIPELSR